VAAVRVWGRQLGSSCKWRRRRGEVLPSDLARPPCRKRPLVTFVKPVAPSLLPKPQLLPLVAKGSPQRSHPPSLPQTTLGHVREACSSKPTAKAMALSFGSRAYTPNQSVAL